MYFHHNNRLAWISIAKNACRSWQQVFNNLGWQIEDLFQPQVDIQLVEFFAFLRWPAVRHTMGVVEYLQQIFNCIAALCCSKASGTVTEIQSSHKLDSRTFILG